MLKTIKLRALAVFITIIFIGNLSAAEEFEIWWEKVLENGVSLSTFQSWLGDINAPSRVAMRRHVKKKGYKSVLDVPAGLCIDYFGFKQDRIPVDYQGVDITPRLVALARKQNIPVIEGDIKSLPFFDNRFDMAYARHILEHLNSCEKALNELIRVASREVLVTFFIKPGPRLVINSEYHSGYLIYYITYRKSDLEQFVLTHPKVSKIEWEEVNEKEIILHIYTERDS